MTQFRARAHAVYNFAYNTLAVSFIIDCGTRLNAYTRAQDHNARFDGVMTLALARMNNLSFIERARARAHI